MTLELPTKDKGVTIQTSSKGKPKLQAISQKLNLEKGVNFVVLQCSKSNSAATNNAATKFTSKFETAIKRYPPKRQYLLLMH